MAPPATRDALAPRSLRERLRDMWAILRGRAPEYAGEPDRGGRRGRRRGRGGNGGEEARVPVGPPRTPPLTGAAALPLPEPEATDLDLYGRPLDDGDERA